MYALIDAEREGGRGADERHELGTSLYIEHLMRLIKAEAHRRLACQAQ
jgi:hypothetical protein